MYRFALFFVFLFGAVAAHSRADEFKQLPPAGIEIDAGIRGELSARVADLDSRIEASAKGSADADRWAPDVEVLVRAVRLALDHNGFFKASELKDAGMLLDEADRRLKAAMRGDRGLKLLGYSGRSSEKPTLVVGGFTSRIDDSVQPYGLVIPAGYRVGRGESRLDVWLHGRGDTKTEIPFLKERMTKVGEYAPAKTFVLHPFGRHCVAFKFAGETDVYEAIEHVSRLFAVDRDRIAMRGFSMGGAGVWHLAVHDPTRWFAANPGAGFVDTIVYQGWDKTKPFEITENRQKLLNWYDVLPWTTNLRNTNLIAYSGEVDKQRAAAERVTSLAKQEGVQYQHIIGKGMGHKIDSNSAKTIDAALGKLASAKTESPRTQIDFSTYLLRYHEADWLSVEGLEEQFLPGRIRAKIVGDHAIEMTTSGVTRLRLDFAKSAWPGDEAKVTVAIDGQTVRVSDTGRATGLQCEIVWDGAWLQAMDDDPALRKRPGMQGPIDDAFCEKFVFVSPSRPATHGKVERWIDREMQYVSKRWQTLMRGKARWVNDVDVTEEMVSTCNLVCFGDFTSNRYLASIAAGLPIGWSREQITVGNKTYNPVSHAAVMCFPNPKNPNRYVVVNSGMTFRDFSNISNSRQIAMLPDWAIIDVDTTNDLIFAGDVVADGFFDEQWKLKTEPTNDRDEAAND
ncbi:prolyl oligopeptidase family serine peptidase [Rubripirellula reticaptiva]|uniref:Prolyl oligopeptidase family protein n=1 Tax=Rubripirellula reticaptiva TaxID=2528013 RepID=A0A5C6FB95_9BACT|nr:prolyl oligopeptidase family serine peptidase [Rubripirellula reticaptiva]TWU57830.1 Prolyl oligopeptidase family protein [Rubripirellula reticaptiva]